MDSFLGYLAISLIRLLGKASLSVAQSVGALVGKWLLLRRTREREVARVNFDLVYPDLSPAERQQLLTDTLIETGKVLGETGPMWGYAPEKAATLIRRVHHKERYDELMAHDGGKLLLAPHLGNWELVNTYVASLGDEMTAMYKPTGNQRFNDWMISRREAGGSRLVPTDTSGVKALLVALKRKRLVGVLPDQEPKRIGGVFADFMGQTALTPKMPLDLIKRTGAKALFAFAKRLEHGEGFEIYFIEPDEAIYSADLEQAAAAMNRSIARCIEHCPAQYQWTYKRFKRQPEGQPNPYKVAKVP